MDNLPVLYKPYKIYLHISPSGGVYVGQTKQDCHKRWKNGYGYRYENKRFYKSIKKYGWENIKHVVLLDNLNKDEANTHEIGLIKAFRNVGKCYNITNGGEGVIGYKASEETRQKLKDSHIGKESGMKGKQHTLETKNKISNTRKKPVMQYAKTGEFLATFKSAVDAQENLGIDQGHISQCCKGKRKTAGGYKWKYKGEC